MEKLKEQIIDTAVKLQQQKRRLNGGEAFGDIDSTPDVLFKERMTLLNLENEMNELVDAYEAQGNL